MATTELMHSVRSMNPEDRAVVMAVAVLMDRLQRLSLEDRQDLLALLKEMAGATSEEERCAIGDAMLEVFECRPSTVEELDMVDSQKRPEALQRWTEYVAKKILDAREAAQLTQEQLSNLSGLPQPHISRIENAKLSPSRITIEKIAKALGKSVADFDFSADRSSES